MTLVLKNETKESLSLSNEEKSDSLTWDSSDPQTWEEQTGKWDAPREPITNEQKNELSLTNEPKILGGDGNNFDEGTFDDAQFEDDGSDGNNFDDGQFDNAQFEDGNGNNFDDSQFDNSEFS
jgi:hypothetical protein